MSNPRTRARCVPRAAFAAIISREYPADSIAYLANMVGCNEAAIRTIWADGIEWLTFEKADRVLSGLGLNHLWHTEPVLIEVGEYLDNARCSMPDCEGELSSNGLCRKHYYQLHNRQRQLRTAERNRERDKRLQTLRMCASS